MRPTSTFFTARGSSGTTLVLAALLLLALGCDAKWAAPTGLAKRVKAALKAGRNERKLEEHVCTSGQYVMPTCIANADGGLKNYRWSYYSDAACGTEMVDSLGIPSVHVMTMPEITAVVGEENPFTKGCGEPFETMIFGDETVEYTTASEMWWCNGTQITFTTYNSSTCTGDVLNTGTQGCDCSDYDPDSDSDDSPACLKCAAPPANCEAFGTILADGGCAAACKASEDAFNEFTSFLNNNPLVKWTLDCPQYIVAKTAVSYTAVPSAPSPTSGDSRAAMPAAVLALLVLVATALLF